MAPASRDLDLDYWIFVLTLSDEEDQEITPAEPPFCAVAGPIPVKSLAAQTRALCAAASWPPRQVHRAGRTRGNINTSAQTVALAVSVCGGLPGRIRAPSLMRLRATRLVSR